MIPGVERNRTHLALESGSCRVQGSQRPAPEGYGFEVSSSLTTILFTDIEGSTRLWEQEGERMAGALAEHDARARSAVEDNHGAIVKTTGDGLFAAFHDPLDAINATVAFQQSLADPAVTHGIPIRVRCGLHCGVLERRDDDYFGTPVNRTARIMSVAHGGQTPPDNRCRITDSRADAIHQAAGEQKSKRVRGVEGGDDVSVINFGPADLNL